MNFKDVIIRGIGNVNNKSDLKSHFIREFKKAERDNFYTVDAFFNPLFQILNFLKHELHSKLEKRIAELQSWIEKAGKNEYNFRDEYYGRCLDKEGIAYDDFKKQSNELWLNDWKIELAEISIDKMRTSSDNLCMNDIYSIEKGLQMALNEIVSQANENYGNSAVEILVGRIGSNSITIEKLKNNFDHNTMHVVYNHFKKGLVDKKHLTNDELLNYLNYAFDKKQLPENKFILKGVSSKQKIYNLFGDYFREMAGKPHGKKPVFVRLLSDYFEGYNYDTVLNNFS